MWKQYNPVMLTAGRGVRSTLAELLPCGAALLVTTEGMLRRGTAQEIMALCPGTAWEVRTIAPNPDLDTVDAMAAALQARPPAAIVALGGGSVMDAAKVLAVAIPSGRSDALDAWLRRQDDLPYPAPLPLICLPSTAGTGAEATPFATIWDNKENMKRSLAHVRLYPQTALLDPELTATQPWETTLFCGLDVFSHALESLWNRNITPVSAACADKSLRLAMPALAALAHDGTDLDAREKMQQASLLAGLAISQNRTALAHSMSYPLTLSFGMPHGFACGFTLPAILEEVDKAHAWSEHADAHLMREVHTALLALDLPTRARCFCTREQAQSRSGGMFTPTRAGNFVLTPDTDMVHRVLARAFGE